MIIGDPKVFAIEYSYVGKSDDFLYGWINFIIANTHVGYPDDDSALLWSSLSESKDFLNRADERYDEILDKCTPEEAFKEIVEDFFKKLPPSCRGRGYPESRIQRLEEARGRFHLCPIGSYSMLDYVQVACHIFKDGRQRIVWKYFDDEVVHHAILPPRTIEETLEKYIVALTQTIEAARAAD